MVKYCHQRRKCAHNLKCCSILSKSAHNILTNAQITDIMQIKQYQQLGEQVCIILK